MRYKHKKGVKKQLFRNKFFIALPVFGILTGAYVLVNTFSPMIPNTLTGETKLVSQKVVEQEPVLDENRLYIPKIGVDVEIVKGATAESLEEGAWHRKPNNGDPTGGNFVLAAHRFELGLTPIQTRAKSPFYHIDQLQPGDEVYADYGGKRFAYEVTRSYDVASNATEIEQRTDNSIMTLYSCNLRGPEEGREVVEAKLIGTVAWEQGKAAIKSTL